MKNEPVALKVNKGEICYLSNEDDQSYGMWCPVNYDTQHGFLEGTKFYTHPAKHLSLQKVDGELVAVTYTDDEHRIIEVLWEKTPAKTLTDEEKKELWNKCKHSNWGRIYEFADAILKKASEK